MLANFISASYNLSTFPIVISTSSPYSPIIFVALGYLFARVSTAPAISSICFSLFNATTLNSLYVSIAGRTLSFISTNLFVDSPSLSIAVFRLFAFIIAIPAATPIATIPATIAAIGFAAIAAVNFQKDLVRNPLATASLLCAIVYNFVAAVAAFTPIVPRSLTYKSVSSVAIAFICSAVKTFVDTVNIFVTAI